LNLATRAEAIRTNDQVLELVRYFFEHQEESAADLGLPSGYALNHVGCLVHGDLETAQLLLQKHQLQIQLQFPSVVLAGQLSDKYRRPVELTILKAVSQELCYEIFCVTNGALSPAEIKVEVIPSFHVAYLGQDHEALTLPPPWRLLVSGTNPHEGCRMAYFTNERVKVELISFPGF